MASRNRTLRCEIGERIQDDEAADVLRVSESEGQRDGSTEGLADDYGTTFHRRHEVDGACEIGGQHLEALGVVSQRIGGNAVGSLETRNLPVEQLPGPIHAGHEDDRTALALDGDPGVVVATHWRHS